MLYKISSGLILLMLSLCTMSAQAQKSRMLLLECSEIGGLTPKGQYTATFRVARTGMIQHECMGKKKTSKLSQADLTLLTREVDTANYAAITANPSGKMSPAAYDGTQTTYIFYGKGQRQEVAPYKFNVPPKTTLFKIVETLRKRYKL